MTTPALTPAATFHYFVIWHHGTALFQTDEEIRDLPGGEGPQRTLMACTSAAVRDRIVAELRPSHAHPSGRYIEAITAERAARLTPPAALEYAHAHPVSGLSHWRDKPTPRPPTHPSETPMQNHLPQILHPENEPAPDLSSFPHRDKNGAPLQRGLYRLTADLDNAPYRDRRATGFWDEAKIPAGTWILVTAHVLPGDEGQAPRLTVRRGLLTSYGDALYQDKEAAAYGGMKQHKQALALFALCVPAAFTQAAEVLHDEAWLGMKVLDELVKQGRLSLREIAVLARKAYNEGASE